VVVFIIDWRIHRDCMYKVRPQSVDNDDNSLVVSSRQGRKNPIGIVGRTSLKRCDAGQEETAGKVIQCREVDEEDISQ
jgi:hypothetical protein